ncbi:MAG: response regulator transcription factor [Phormidesmis sp.]
MEDIVVCAAQSVTRAGIAAMAKIAATQIVAKVDSLQALENWLQTQRADLAVIEISMLGPAESEAIFQLIEGLPLEDTLSLLLLLEKGIEATAKAGAAQLIGTGIVNMVPMDISADQLRCAILAVVSGLNILYPSLTEVLFTRDFTGADPPFNLTESLIESDSVDPLTPREVEVLNQLASGLSNKAIAKALTISEHTVKFHISAILAKLSVSSRTEAVSVGIRAGLVRL